jgi:hypothetical protein
MLVVVMLVSLHLPTLKVKAPISLFFNYTRKEIFSQVSFEAFS